MQQEHLVMVGKGGVGKSSVASNISAALAADGYRVLQIGYGHSRDSTATLRGGREAMPLFIGREIPMEKVIEGFNGVFCLEAGRLIGGSKGKVLRQLSVEIERHRPDIVVHDVSWESYGERLAQPFGSGPVKAFAVVSADFPAIAAANSIFRTFGCYPFCRRVNYSGVIANGLTATFSQAMVADFSRRCGATVHSSIPHSLVVMASELYGKTVLEAAPLSQHAFVYRKLAKNLTGAENRRLPCCLDDQELKDWGQSWAGIINELETGSLTGGAGI